MNGGGRRRVRVVRVSLFIVFICPPPSLLSVSPSAPGVCVADKRERRRRQGVDTVLSVWAVCPAGPGTRSKGLAVGLPLLLPAFVSPDFTPTPSRKPFCGDETAGLLGQAGLRIKDQAG